MGAMEGVWPIATTGGGRAGDLDPEIWNDMELNEIVLGQLW